MVPCTPPVVERVVVAISVLFSSRRRGWYAPGPGRSTTRGRTLRAGVGTGRSRHIPLYLVRADEVDVVTCDVVVAVVVVEGLLVKVVRSGVVA